MKLEEIWDKIKDKTMQHKEEFLWLLTLILEKEYKTVLEIGSYKGGTALGFLEIGCEVACVDKDPHPDLITNLRGHDYYLHKIDSTHVLRLSYGMLDAIAWEVLYIDGGHDYETCKADFENYKDMVRNGGIIVIHDINPTDGKNTYGSSTFWNEIKEHYKHEEKIVDPNTWGGFGLVYV